MEEDDEEEEDEEEENEVLEGEEPERKGADNEGERKINLPVGEAATGGTIAT